MVYRRAVSAPYFLDQILRVRRCSWTDDVAHALVIDGGTHGSRPSALSTSIFELSADDLCRSRRTHAHILGQKYSLAPWRATAVDVVEHHALGQQLAKGSSILTRPRSRMTLVQKRAYSRCRMVCSTPPMYWSMGIQ